MSEDAALLREWAAQAASLRARIRADAARRRAWAYDEEPVRAASSTGGSGGPGKGGVRPAAPTDTARSRMSGTPKPGPHAGKSGPTWSSIAGRYADARATPTSPMGRGRASSAAPGGGGSGARTPAGLVARGYAPAVVKVVSYASGSARAKATAQYVLREDVEIETHDGRALTDREAVNAEIEAWSGRFGKREPTQDVIGVRIGIFGLRDEAADRGQLRRAVEAGFAGHRYAYRLEAGTDGSIGAQVVVVAAGEGRERFKVAGQRIGDAAAGFERRILDPASEARIKARMEAATGAGQHRMRLEPSAPGHGVEAVRHRLDQLVAGGPAVADDGRPIGDAAAVHETARSWQPHLRSQRARDTMHLVVSARAGTDRQAFRDAVRDFLGDTFSDHTFLFGVHTDTERSGHIHAHAVVAVRGMGGAKIHPGPQDLRRWREAYAEHAQAQGLRIVATTAQERASSQSYGRRDKAIVDAADHPRPGREARDRAYARHPANQEMIANARARMARARANPIRVPEGAQALERTAAVARVWGDLARAEPENAVAAGFARRMQEAHRLGAQAEGRGAAVPEVDRKALPRSHRVDEAATGQGAAAPPRSMTVPRTEADLEVMKQEAAAIAARLTRSDRERYERAVARVVQASVAKLELQRLIEAGHTHIDEATARALLPPDRAEMVVGAIRRHRAQERDQEQREPVRAESRSPGAVAAEPQSASPALRAPEIAARPEVARRAAQHGGPEIGGPGTTASRGAPERNEDPEAVRRRVLQRHREEREARSRAEQSRDEQEMD